MDMQKKRSSSVAKPQPTDLVQNQTNGVATPANNSPRTESPKKVKSISTQLGPNNPSFIKQEIRSPARKTRPTNTKVKRSYRFESASPTQSSSLHGSTNGQAQFGSSGQNARSGSAGNNVKPAPVSKSGSFRSDSGAYENTNNSFEAKARENALKLESRLRQWSEMNAAADGFRVKLKKQPGDA